MRSPDRAAFFAAQYRRDAAGIAFCPGRVVPVGAHSDHQLGRMTGMAVDLGVYAAYAPADDAIRVSSRQFDQPVSWPVTDVPAPRGDWADHLRGAVRAMQKRFPLYRGMDVLIDSQLPMGGLSSSTAVIVAFARALADVNGIALTADELPRIAYEAEHDYVGVSIGMMDPTCVVHGKAGHLLCLDAATDQRTLIPNNAHMPDFRIAVLYSGLPRSLSGTDFNRRVEDMHRAAAALLNVMGTPCDDFRKARLRSVPRSVYEANKGLLTEGQRLRAEHFYTEQERVDQAVSAWRRGDLVSYGALSTQSGASSIGHYQSGSPELIALYELLRAADGVYGGRFAGAGYRGCCIALVAPEHAESISRIIGESYGRMFPKLREKYRCLICNAADGVGESL